ncbi:MAG: insulinase family protein [Bacteroidia bacterium]
MKTLKFNIALLVISLFCISARAQEVVELKKPELNKVIVKLMFRAGSIADPAGKEGLTSFTATLVKEGGTANLTKSQIDERIYPMAAAYGVSTDKEVTVFTFAVPVDFVNEFYPIMKGLILDPSFSESDFNRVKTQQLNYVTRAIRNSSDEDYSKMVLEDFLFRGKNYQHMVAGTEKGLNSITLEDVKEHWQRYFTKDNLMIGITGNYSDAFLAELKLDMQGLPALDVELPQAEKAEMPEGTQVEIVSKPGAFGSAIFMGFPMDITRSNDDFAALMVANSYLGEHRKSYGKLYNKIRETRSMNYGDYSYIEWYPSGSENMLPVAGYPRSSNYFSMWIRPVQIGAGLREQHEELADVKLGHAHFAIRMAVRELNTLIVEGMNQEDFDLTKKFLRSYIKLYISSPGQELGYLMDSRFYGREDWINKADKLLEQLTLQDVNDAMKEHLQTRNMKIAVITSPDEATDLAKSLMENHPSPMSYSNIVKEGLPEEVLREDEQVAKYPLNIKSVKIVKTEDTLGL